jgi:hypothetical protein
MRPVKFGATLRKVSLRAPEEGGSPEISIFVSLSEPNRRALAALCEKPDEALSVLESKVPRKEEFPAGREVCMATIGDGSKVHKPDHVIFNRVLLDTRGGETQTRIDYSESKTAAGWAFYGSHIGQQLEFEVAPSQVTIDDEIEAKKKETKAKGGEKAEE